MLMPCPLTLTAIIVAIPTPHVSAQPRDNYARTVVPLATTLPYVSARGPSTNTTLPGKETTMVEVTEVQEAPGGTNHPKAVTDPGAGDSAPGTLQSGSHATAAPAVASPTALPIVPLTMHLPLA